MHSESSSKLKLQNHFCIASLTVPLSPHTPLLPSFPSSSCCCFAFVSCLVPLLCVFHRSDDEDVVASLMGADFCRNLRLKCFALAIVHCASPCPFSCLCASCGPFCCSLNLLFFCLYKFYFNFLWLVFVVAQPFNRSAAEPLDPVCQCSPARLCSPAHPAVHSSSSCPSIICAYFVFQLTELMNAIPDKDVARHCPNNLVKRIAEQ